MDMQGNKRLQNLINGPLGVMVAMFLTRFLPSQIGYPLAEYLGRLIARNKNSSIVQSVRQNQWVASGCTVSSEHLDNLTNAVIINHARCLYDFYKYFNNPAKIRQIISLDDKFLEVIEKSRSHSEAQILVIPHFSNYELAARAAAVQGLTMQVLSYPNPGHSYKWQNKFRNFMGIEVTPVSVSSLRQAAKRLNNGGTVLTGVDRPLGDSNSNPIFFGHPALLPTGYIRLAIKTNATIRVILCKTTSDPRYLLSVSDPISVDKLDNSENGLRRNAEKVLSVIEVLISKNPEYWSMFYPVWPQIQTGASDRDGRTKNAITKEEE
jgi:KDO2-lipid IV(A) lauroyltransferase